MMVFFPYFPHVFYQIFIHAQLNNSFIKISPFLQRFRTFSQLVLQEMISIHPLLQLTTKTLVDGLELNLIALQRSDDVFVVILPLVYCLVFLTIIDPGHLQLHSQAFYVFFILFSFDYQLFYLAIGVSQLIFAVLQLISRLEVLSLVFQSLILHLCQLILHHQSLIPQGLPDPLFSVIQYLLYSLLLLGQFVLFLLQCVFQGNILALVKLNFLICLFLLQLDILLMFFIHEPQFSILFFEEIGVIFDLDHGFHEIHAKGSVLIFYEVDVYPEIIVNALHLYLQLSYQILQSSYFLLPGSPLFDFNLNLLLIIQPNPIILVMNYLDLLRQDFNLILINLDHFLEIILISLRQSDLQDLILSHQMLRLLLQSFSQLLHLLKLVESYLLVQLILEQLLYYVLSTLQRYLQVIYLIFQELVLGWVVPFHIVHHFFDEIISFIPLILAFLQRFLLQLQHLLVELSHHLIPEFIDLFIMCILQLIDKDAFPIVKLHLLLLKLSLQFLQDLTMIAPLTDQLLLLLYPHLHYILLHLSFHFFDHKLPIIILHLFCFLYLMAQFIILDLQFFIIDIQIIDY